MSLPKRYDAQATELRLQSFWKDAGVYHFSRQAEGPIYRIARKAQHL